MTRHYIFMKPPARSNNINDLRPTEGPSLLKIRQAEVERLQKEREQREAVFRAQVEKEQAEASQFDKERFLNEALDKERARQADQDKARAERERAAGDETARELQAETERVEGLTARLAQLEQQAAEAKTTAAAQVQTGEDAKKKVAESAKVASITPATAPVECSIRETRVNGRCVPKACPRGETLSRVGRCLAAPAPVRAAVEHEVARPKTASPSHNRCFVFNGSRYCE
jgi:hypothetical protein